MKILLLFIFFSIHFSFVSVSQPDSAEVITIGNFFFEGNKTTRSFIITRELTFRQGDSLKRPEVEEKIRQSEKNLMNTSLFNFARIEPTADSLNPAILNFTIKVTERWYLWPVPIFELAETNFNTWWKGKNFERTNYGIYVVKENFRGRKELIRFKLQLGFTEQFALQYQIPYINKKQTLGLSMTTGYWGNHEVNYGTSLNKRLFLKDNDRYLRQEFYSRITFSYRKAFFTTQLFELQYIDGEIADSVAYTASDYFKDGITKTKYFYLLYQFRHNKLDYNPYPLEGYYYGIDLVKYGLGILPAEPNTLTAYFSIAKHNKVSRRFYFSNGAYLKLNFFEAPFYSFQRGLGYDDFVRGYEYYVIDGQYYGLLRNNLKFLLLKSHEEKVPLIKNEKFGKFFYSIYLNAFVDLGYVQDKLYYKENPLANTLMHGAGLGLDFMTYYDMVMRGEYSINKMGEPGFYLSFKKAI